MRLVLGDITQVSADAVINTANAQLKHGGGVAAVVLLSGGDTIRIKSAKIGWCNIGEATDTHSEIESILVVRSQQDYDSLKSLFND